MTGRLSPRDSYRLREKKKAGLLGRKPKPPTEVGNCRLAFLMWRRSAILCLTSRGISYARGGPTAARITP
jgi:hypothetical protein